MKSITVFLSILISLTVYSQNINNWNMVDTNLVKSYLGKSFNDFRLKRGKPVVKISTSLNKECEKYSRKLSPKYFKHESIDVLGYNSLECIGSGSLMSDLNFGKNKITNSQMVADSMFNVFLNSKGHMELLLSDYLIYGVGVTFNNNGYYIVVRGYEFFYKE